ncbi:hypothetical protein DPSP01_000629 [Paraphaeosphaeria sporulosa]|uniref:feruloyl esterase n=1 Tax=Paraphaeosphaeria sporulosa TaxID=1460663 RepID=A0A177CA80_9PLEO|nr:alpha/beta-hydrolase [Paraphaeosphaeria sporulosa]OAG03752.1 alpha/beta-hydrolase [Paraphaeosphaeria sporulosa]
MKSFSLLATLLIPATALQRGGSGCGKALPESLRPGGPSKNLTLESKSQINATLSRSFLMYIPEHFSASNNDAKPLVLAFHGQSQPNWSMERITNLSAPNFNKDYIVAYPAGLDTQWLGDPAAPPSSVIDDRIFVSELLDYLTSTFCIDESRIYITGLSNGGGLTGLLACDPAINRRVAAFAAVAGAFYADASLTEPLFGVGCKPELDGRKLPLMEMHGLNDSVIAYDGNNSPAPDSIPLPSWVNSWVDREGCGQVNADVQVLDGGNLTRSAWSCDGRNDVIVHYKINDFGHGWPSTAWQGEPFETLRLRPTSWNATGLILDWFEKWRLAV